MWIFIQCLNNYFTDNQFIYNWYLWKNFREILFILKRQFIFNKMKKKLFWYFIIIGTFKVFNKIECTVCVGSFNI